MAGMGPEFRLKTPNKPGGWCHGKGPPPLWPFYKKKTPNSLEFFPATLFMGETDLPPPLLHVALSSAIFSHLPEIQNIRLPH